MLQKKDQKILNDKKLPKLIAQVILEKIADISKYNYVSMLENL